MCLYVDRRETDRQLQDKSNRVFFKLFCCLHADSIMRTPYRLFPIKDYDTLIKVESPASRTTRKDISEGAFHARLTKEAVELSDVEQTDYFIKGNHSLYILPIHVYYEDIIAYGLQGDVAVKAFTITKHDWVHCGEHQVWRKGVK